VIQQYSHNTSANEIKKLVPNSASEEQFALDNSDIASVHDL
jgi:hypothetical protein